MEFVSSVDHQVIDGRLRGRLVRMVDGRGNGEIKIFFKKNGTLNTLF